MHSEFRKSVGIHWNSSRISARRESPKPRCGPLWPWNSPWDSRAFARLARARIGTRRSLELRQSPRSQAGVAVPASVFHVSRWPTMPRTMRRICSAVSALRLLCRPANSSR